MPTIIHRLARWADETPDAIAQRYKSGGAWQPITAREFRDRIHYLALFLRSKGITPTDVGAVLSYNCPQWVHMELAMLLLGAKTAGLYPNSTPKDIQYILKHTGASVLSVQNRAYMDKVVAEGAGQPKDVRVIIVFDDVSAADLGAPGAVTYAQALSEGRKLSTAGGAESFASMLSKIDPKAGSILIYTSGTTANPKGALLSHDNLVFTSDVVAKAWSLPSGRGSIFSFLPLCHVAEQLQNVGVGITQRYAASFASSFDNVSKELPEVQPTLLLCVPRLWEKMMEGVQNKVAKSSPVKRRMFNWAMAVGGRVQAARLAKRRPNPLDLVQLRLADKLVLSKARAAMGLAHAEKLASGAAALPAHVVCWFRGLGLEILEDFGQTESTGVILMTEPGVDCAGTVGKPAPGVEFKLAADGEILTRGRTVFVGYFKDETATKEALTSDGWLHTGDLGAMTEKALVKIIGRKKEIMKTSGGKMIAPMPIEERLKTSEMVSQACMVGDGRKYLAVLITLAEQPLKDVRAKPGGVDGVRVRDEAVLGLVKAQIDALNLTLASYEQIKKFTVLAREFTVEDGEMTPTLKVKRSVIEKRYHDVIEQMYQ